MRSEGYGSRPVCVCVCQCVCQCVQASHPLLTQLQDQVDIPMDSVSCSLVFKFGVFRIMAKIAVAFPYLRAHGSRPFCMYASIERLHHRCEEGVSQSAKS